MSDFELLSKWRPQKGNAEADATLCKLQIKVGGQIVSEFRDEHEQIVRQLEIPAYYLAEWIAENWWPLLWEPRKNEDGGDNADFLSRHSFLAAQHGFALPKVLLVA